MLYGCLGVDAGWECFCNQVGVVLTCALMGDFVEEEQSWIGECTSTFDALITGVVDEAVEFALEVLGVLEHLCFLGLVACVVKGNQPIGIDALLEVLMDEVSDAPFEALLLECFWWCY